MPITPHFILDRMEQIFLDEGLEISVTPADIARAAKDSDYNNPIARATRRQLIAAFGNERGIVNIKVVDRHTLVCWLRNGGMPTMRLGTTLQQWLTDFDLGRQVEPFTLTLTPDFVKTIRDCADLPVNVY